MNLASLRSIRRRGQQVNVSLKISQSSVQHHSLHGSVSFQVACCRCMLLAPCKSIQHIVPRKTSCSVLLLCVKQATTLQLHCTLHSDNCNSLSNVQAFYAPAKPSRLMFKPAQLLSEGQHTNIPVQVHQQLSTLQR